MSEHPSAPAPDDGAPGPDKLTGHDYDGIREYDNPTPGWWHAIFLGTIVFSVLYIVVVHMSSWREALDPHARHALAAERTGALRLQALGALSGDTETLVRLAESEAALEQGRAIYQANCVACHRNDGGGVPGLGPNLTDDFAINVRSPEDVFRTIAEGVSGTAMLPWEPLIGHDDAVLVAAYVVSLRGREVAGGKEPEGERMPAWPSPEAGGG
jgi:cytochrome c oxidase cbb3-type subunit III